jgi:Fe2+ transport system protein FeoA
LVEKISLFFIFVLAIISKKCIIVLAIANKCDLEWRMRFMTLDQIKVGGHCTIKLVNGEGRVRRRMFDMGVTPGINVYVRKKAPLGDPIEITIRGYELTLRLDEAKLIEVVKNA